MVFQVNQSNPVPSLCFIPLPAAGVDAADLPKAVKGPG